GQATENIEKYNFSFTGELLRDFTWNDLADWYLETAKVEGDKEEILNYILNTILKLWHPYMPFVTEAIWQEVYGKSSFLMVQRWPIFLSKETYSEEESAAHQIGADDFEQIRNLITSVRALRADYKIEPAKKLSVLIVAGDRTKLLEQNVDLIRHLARLDKVEIESKAKKPEDSIGCVSGVMEIFIYAKGIVDFAKEKARLEKEIEDINRYTDGLEKILSNSEFAQNAPAEVVEKEKLKLSEASEKITKLSKQLDSLK
ncbi:class I tRNA ligase family protein, partial [Patescibacteria group bacterium]|nr:class I tRNA ligase family protein [Patescibacteria group bacterium]